MWSVLSWWPAVLAVLLLCWGVGACSRLLRLRAAVVQAFDALAPIWQRRLVWVQACAVTVESDAARRLSAARNQCALALEQARKKPFQAAFIQSLTVAGGTLQAVWASLPDEQFPAKSETSGLNWGAFQHQALPLQLAFNVQVERYNRAIAQFPASVMASVARLKRAALLPITEDTR